MKRHQRRYFTPKATRDGSQKPRARTPSRRDMVMGIFLAVMTIIGGIVAVMTLIPRVSISINGPTDIANALSIIVTVTNNSMFSLSDVWVSLGICEIDPKSDSKKHNTCNNILTYFVPKRWHRDILSVDEKYNVPIGEIFTSGNLHYADISIRVDFYSWLWPWKFLREQRFHTKRRGDGRLDWLYGSPE